MVTFVPTPIGNLEDISYRAIKTLQKAKIIFCEDSRVTKKLFLLLSQKFNLSFNPDKFIPMHSHNEKELLSTIDKTIFDKDVVYVSDAGMPGISDPAYHLIKFCQQNSIKYDILPGANASLLAFVGSAFSEKEFLFIGFLPHKGEERSKKLREVMSSGYVTILYEAPHRIKKLIEEITLIDPDRRIYGIKEATKLYQKSFLEKSSLLMEIFKESNLKGEWTLVIDRGERVKKLSLSLEEILNLPLPKKEKAKLLAKITNKTTKEWYKELN